MSGASYVSKPAIKELSFPRKVIPLVSLLLAVMVGIISLGAGLFVKPQEAQAGPVEWVVCEWAGEGSLPHFAYEAAFTDNIAYMFNSKSAISSGTEDVSGGLNMLLGITHDFSAINEAIMGTGLTPTSDYEGEINGGTKVNPYDRFGVAGMYWSSYGGEWNYLKVDVCGGGSEPVNMRIGAYYEERLAPLSTWGGISQSTDVRSLAAAQKGLVLAHDWVNIVANGIFNITKFLVVATNALIGLAFSDILGAVGLTDLIASDGGIFNKFYTGIYLMLILIVMLVMATWAFWHGIVKRSYRRTLGGIAQSVVMFVMAAVVAFNPAFFITLPNNIAVIAQSLIVNTMSTSLYGGDGLCAVGGVYTVNAEGERVLATPDSSGKVNVDPGNPNSATDVNDSLNLLEQASQSMQSVIGCQLWYTYVLKPWTSGQFGTDFDNLWAKGHADTAISADSKELPNENEAWVGDAGVPLGGGYTINNWALFQISTHTNAHVPLGQEEPARATYTDGVANDWWRIVDAVSNYNETKQSNGIPSGSACDDTTVIEGAGHCNSYDPSDTEPVESTIPDTSKKPTDYWQNWIGAKPGDRMAAALGSVLPALLGNIAPLLFAGMSAVFALAIAIAMAISPIFLLFGSWPGNGWNIFKSWAQLVLNMTMKRIIAGILLVISLILISMVLHLVRDNWFISLIVLILISVALIKFRSQLFDKLAGIFSFNFASSGLENTGARATQLMRRGVAETAGFVGRVGTGAMMGAQVAKEAGQTPMQGVKAGLRQELRNTIYRSPTWNRSFMDAENMLPDKAEDQRISDREICAYCTRPLKRPGMDEITFNGGIDEDGNFVCEECMNNPHATISGRNPYNFGARRAKRKFMTEEDAKRYRGLDFTDGEAARNMRTPVTPGTLVASTMDDDLDELQTKFKNPETGETADNLPELVGKLFAREAREAKLNNTVPAPPKALEPYLTPEAREAMPQLWKDPNPQALETIALAYSHAFVQYSYTVGKLDVGDLSGDVRKGVQGDMQVVLASIVKELNDKEQDRDTDNANGK